MDFYNFFSFSGKKAIYRASEVCAQFNNQYLEPEHIFYSILNLRSCSAVQVLHQLHVNLPKMAYSLEAYLYEHSSNYKGSSSFSTRTLALLDLAFKEVKRMHHREIGTTHLLVGLSQERSQFLRKLFEEHGLNHKKIRDMFMMHLKGDIQEDDAQAGPAITRGRKARLDSTGSSLEQLLVSDLIFSPACQRILARAALSSFNSEAGYIEPIHLFIAMLGKQDSAAHWMLANQGLDAGSCNLGPGQGSSSQSERKIHHGFSEASITLLDNAQTLQHRLRQRELLTAHILLEMLREPDPELKPLFEAAGISFGDALKKFLEYLLEEDVNSRE